MSPAIEQPVTRIVLRLQMGSDRMAATDDPVFLGLRGPDGREFRVAPAHGKALRRGGDEQFVFGAPDDGETNVAEPALNDPNAPALDAARIQGLYLRKRQDAFPNVRGMGELDDRLQVEAVEATLECADGSTHRYARRGPIWLGLTSGLSIELAPAGSDD
ncbi:MAG: hypothetical protein HKP30_05860 [Myxococcales bacterium]|nr:hypothetical protein [Myxococcales bacterium]